MTRNKKISKLKDTGIFTEIIKDREIFSMIDVGDTEENNPLIGRGLVVFNKVWCDGFGIIEQRVIPCTDIINAGGVIINKDRLYASEKHD